MTFYVEPGAGFRVSYVSDGVTTEYPVPDVTAETTTVSLHTNGLRESPFESYTVHQGVLSLTKGPLPTGFKLEVSV